jgi:hypothetical protein
LGRYPEQDLENLRIDDRVNLADVESSLILQKPTLELSHRGGLRFTKGSWEYQMLKRWIAQGAILDVPPPVQSLRIEPAKIHLGQASESTSLRILATRVNGSAEDVSRLVVLTSTDESIVSIDRDTGRIQRGKSSGVAHVVASYGTSTAICTVVVPFANLGGTQRPLSRKSRIDEFIGQQLHELGIEPARECSDAEFLRRVSLDLTGQLPTPEALKAFLADPRPDRRERKIDELLDSEAYSWRWANYLCLLSGCTESAVKKVAASFSVERGQVMNLWLGWLQRRVADDVPYDQIVRNMLAATSQGNQELSRFRAERAQTIELLHSQFDDNGLFANGPCNDLFWRTQLRSNREPEAQQLVAEELAQSFLGTSLACARCHDHPLEAWSQADHHGFAAIFAGVDSGLPIHREEHLGATSVRAGLLVGCMAGLVLAIGLLLRMRSFLAAFSALVILSSCCTALTLIVPNYLGTVLPALRSSIPPLIDSETLIRGRLIVGVLAALFVTFLGAVFVVRSLRVLKRGSRKWIAIPCTLAAPLGASALVLGEVALVSYHSAHLSEGDAGQWLRDRVEQLFRTKSYGPPVGEVFVEWPRPLAKTLPRALDGTVLADRPDRDPRSELMDRLASDPNSLLAQNIVNRVWEQYFGRALAQPTNARSPHQPATHPELLHWLTNDFVANKWSLKHLHRQIVNSAAYQMSCRHEGPGVDDSRNYARNFPRRLRTEHLVLAIRTVLGSELKFDESSIARGAMGDRVPLVYPRGDNCAEQAYRVLQRTSEGAPGFSLEAALFLVLDQDINQAILAPGSRLDRALTANADPAKLLDDFYLIALSRPASREEHQRVTDHIRQADNIQTAWQDVVWALLNTREFQFNH